MYATRTSHTAGNFEFSIDGQQTSAYVKSIQGGWSHAELGTSGKTVHEVVHITNVYLDPIVVEFGAASSPDMLKWIQQSWSGKETAPRDGQVTYADFDLRTTLEQDFHQTQLTETSFPALDGSSKEGGYIKCTMLPEWTQYKWHTTPGPKLAGASRPSQKMWTPAAFRFNLDGISGMEYTNRIEPITVKTSVSKCLTGVFRMPDVTPCQLQYPKISGTISLRYAESLMNWHRNYVRSRDGAGTKDRDAYKSGSIEFLTPDRKDTLFSIQLSELAPLYVGLEPSKANSDLIQRVKFELYVKKMTIVGSSLMGFR
jgi:hypothetical protein